MSRLNLRGMKVKLLPAPPIQSVDKDLDLGPVEWVMIYLLTGRERHSLPRLGDSSDVFRRAKLRRNFVDLPTRIHQRAVDMMGSLPIEIQERGRGSVKSWSDLRRIGESLDGFYQDKCFGQLSEEKLTWFYQGGSRQIELVAHALIYLGDQGEASSRGRARCMYCWRPTSERRKFCEQHASNTTEYRRRHRAYDRERKLLLPYIREIRKDRKNVARELGLLDEGIYEIDGEVGRQVDVLRKGVYENDSIVVIGADIDPWIVSELPRFWPAIAKYIEFSKIDAENIQLGDVLVRLEYGSTPEEAISNMQSVGVPFF